MLHQNAIMRLLIIKMRNHQDWLTDVNSLRNLMQKLRIFRQESGRCTIVLLG